MSTNQLFTLLTISLLFAGCGQDWKSLVWIDPIDGGTDGSVPDSGNDGGSTDGGPSVAGPPDGGGDGGTNPCIPNPCNAPNKGACTPTGVSTFSCSCNAGYHDVSGTCVLDQACQGNSCGGHGNCSADGGTIACACDVGYEPLYCGTCSTNWQDNDSNGSCLKACAHPTLGLNCNGHGNCSDSTGTAVCACNANWAAPNCAACVSGFQDNDNNGTCAPACASGTCNGHGNCSDSSGTAACTCNANWAAPNCAACVSGFQDNDNNGVCAPACASGTCNGRGTCLDTSGTATCTCTGNWDPAANCLTCKPGFGGANCDPVAVITVTKIASGTSTNLVNGDNTPPCAQISADGGSGFVARQTWDVQFTGGGGPTSVSLYRDAWNGTLISGGASQVVTLAPFAGKWVATFTTEDVVPSGSSKVYCLRVAATGVVATSRLTVTLLVDSAATPSMVGGTGYVHSTSGSTLYTSADGLCQGAPPYFVMAVLPHTAPTPTCNISATTKGDPVYITGFQTLGGYTPSDMVP